MYFLVGICFFCAFWYTIFAFIFLFSFMASKTNANKQGGSSFQSILLVILIALSALQIYFLTGNSLNLPGQQTNDVFGIKKALLDIEYEKVGGKEAYDLIVKMQQLTLNNPQNPQNLAAMREYVA